MCVGGFSRAGTEKPVLSPKGTERKEKVGTPHLRLDFRRLRPARAGPKRDRLGSIHHCSLARLMLVHDLMRSQPNVKGGGALALVHTRVLSCSFT